MGTYTGSDKRLQYLFQNGGGGGGTTVIANPQGEATDTLNKLQVESTIYSVSGGSGSGSANNVKQLWSGALNTLNGTLTLSESYKHFDLLIVKWSAHATVDYYQGNEVIPTAEIVENQTYQFGDSFYRSTGQFCQMAFSITNETTLTLDQIQINGANAGVTIQAVYGLCVGGGFIGLGDIYSTEERQVGVWTDGKPLYQKTVSGTSASNFSTPAVIVDLGSGNTIKAFYGIIDGTREINSRDSDSNRSYTWIAQNGYQLANFATGSNYANKPTIVTVQYTKTTDTAGSGIWTPSGSYAEHYSTEEQVIGTWTDGKPIYRKILPTQSFGNTDVAYNHNIGIHMYLRYYGSCTINNNLIPRAFPCYQHRYSQYCELGGYNANQVTFSSNWSGNTATAILEYTKESDYT